VHRHFGAGPRAVLANVKETQGDIMLIPNWRAVAARAWSVRLLALLTLLQILDIVLQLVGMRLLPFGELGNAIAIAAVAGAAFIARFIAQKKVTPPKESQP